MKIKLKALNVQFQRSLERLDLTSQITFFHGQISTGKSTVARLVDYCLGGQLHSTPALNQELVSVQLNLQVDQHDVLLEREGLKASNVRASWSNAAGERASVLAPSVAADAPIWGDSVYNVSDLLFYLAGITPIKVRRSKRDPDSKLVRLSFRDLMWYCYLEQDDLDSSFFKLEDDSRKYKSRDVMRFVVGFYTEYLNELELDLERTTDERRAKEEGAQQIRAFLEELGYGSGLEIQVQVSSVTSELQNSRADLADLRAKHRVGTHFADDLRQTLTLLAQKLDRERQALADVESRISDQDQLRAELISAKFKLSRAQAASTVLTGAEFDRCPACGTELRQIARTSDECLLCGTKESQRNVDAVRAEAVNEDLDSRIDDLEMSLRQHRRTISEQRRTVEATTAEKAALDRRLADELQTYDSAFLSNAREAERQVASLEERLRNLLNIARMPEALDRLTHEIAGLQIKERSLREQIQNEKGKLKAADSIVTELEDTYLQIMVEVGVPGVSSSDGILIDRLTWIPTIFPKGQQEQGYDFYSAGSGGKKTLLNVCYALAIHKVTAQHNLPLPSFLIIDSPMKNIGKEVNKQTFLALYAELYSLAGNSLRDTQFIIIDNEFAPPPATLNVKDRYMPPPLIPGYEGA